MMKCVRSLQVGILLATIMGLGGQAMAAADAPDCGELSVLWRAHRAALQASSEYMTLSQTSEYRALRAQQRALDARECWRLDRLGECEADWHKEAELDRLVRLTDAFEEAEKLPLYALVIKLEAEALAAGCLLLAP